jgi:hypothetical protein
VEDWILSDAAIAEHIATLPSDTLSDQAVSALLLHIRRTPSIRLRDTETAPSGVVDPLALTAPHPSIRTRDTVDRNVY